MSGVDIVIVTALKEEYDAVRAACLSDGSAGVGVANWEERAQENPRYLFGEYALANGSSFSIALARPTRMGSAATGPVAASLVERLKPICLAMSGVCAGNPDDVALGDVVVAEMVYEYDEGKRTESGFQPDHRQYLMLDSWVRTAQELSPNDLPSHGQPSAEEARLWVLERLYAGDKPTTHPARDRYFSRETWKGTLESLRSEGLVSRRINSLSLTNKGKTHVERREIEDPYGPERLPFEIVVGPVASGSVVVKDGRTWHDLKRWGVRTVVGLEMEAATIASIAHRLNVAQWVVVKGVMDHADPRKDDRYKGFAARASGEVLIKLLRERFTVSGPHLGSTQTATESRVRAAYVIGGVTGETAQRDFEDAQLTHISSALGLAVARSGADLVVCSPFPDSADVHTVMGYVNAGLGGRVHFHSPRHPRVQQKHEELLQVLGPTATRFVDWIYPGPEDDESWVQAWLLCQLQALERANVVIAIGGRVSASANTLLHLAEARQLPVVPFSFFGGAAARAFGRLDWGAHYPDFDPALLTSKDSLPQAMEIANELVAARFRARTQKNWSLERVFISRARQDAEYASALERHLNEAGQVVLLGDAQLRSDRMVDSSIEDAILGCDLFLALWSSAFGLSPFCNDELEIALERHAVGDMEVWIFNLDGTDVVPRKARGLPQVVSRTPQVAIQTLREILEPRYRAGKGEKTQS